MKLWNKRLLICLMAIIIVFSSFSIAFADGSSTTSQVDTAVGNLNTGTVGGTGEYDILVTVMSYMAWIGFAIAIFKLIQIGMMFMAGVGTRRSDAKSAILPWLVGAAICALFGVLGPWFIGLISSGDSGNIFDSGTTASASTSNQGSQKTYASGQQENQAASNADRITVNGNNLTEQ